MLIKICGLRSPEHALAAAAAGADLLGLVFAPSRRQVSVAEAQALVRALRAAPVGQKVVVVGLFVNASASAINQMVDAVGLDLVQLSGDEGPEIAPLVSRPLIKALRIDGSEREQRWLTWAAGVARRPGGDAVQRAPAASAGLLIDAHVPGSYGGTGVLADWQRAAELARNHHVLLAGGLTPENVAAARAAVQPWGVDVSSGVETNGVKDVAKIEAFIAAARN